MSSTSLGLDEQAIESMGYLTVRSRKHYIALAETAAGRAWLLSLEFPHAPVWASSQTQRQLGIEECRNLRYRVHAMQLNQVPSAAAANRARLESDRTRAIQKEETRVYRIEQRLAQSRRPEAITKAKRKLESARRRLAYVRIHGSLPAKKDRGRLQGFK